MHAGVCVCVCVRACVRSSSRVNNFFQVVQHSDCYVDKVHV